MTALALAFVLAATAQPVLAASCANSEQIRAAQLRQFHYELQVAALNCRHDDPSLPGKWQAYVQRHGATLSDNARVLHGYFKGAAAFDRYNTTLTNRESTLVHEIQDYCDLRAPMFDKAVTLNGPQLASYAAETVGQPDVVSACKQAQAKPAKKADKSKG